VENNNLMLRATFACLLALCPCAVLAEEPVQVWLDPGFLSYHFNGGDYRQDNWGFGVGVFVAPEHGFIAGTYLNSDDERSRYAAYHWRPLDWDYGALNLRAGLVLGVIDGYSNTNHGHWFPAVLPALTAEYGHLGANLAIAPNPHHGTAIALQLRLRVW
jgi:hypothetical protein